MLNPRLIHTSICGYGRGGSFASKKAYDLLIQYESGLLSVTGTPESPTKVGVSIADISAGMYAYSGILTALIQRGKSGRGDVIEVSMLEALAEWVSRPYFYTEYGGQTPRRSGAENASIAPGPFPAADGTVFFGVQNESEFKVFCSDVLESPGLFVDPCFQGNAARVVNRPALHEAINAVLQRYAPRRFCSGSTVPGSPTRPLRTPAELSAHPQLTERQRWRNVESPVGLLRSLVPPVTSRESAIRMDRIPGIGEHTATILAELGMTETIGI